MIADMVEDSQVSVGILRGESTKKADGLHVGRMEKIFRIHMTFRHSVNVRPQPPAHDNFDQSRRRVAAAVCNRRHSGILTSTALTLESIPPPGQNDRVDDHQQQIAAHQRNHNLA
jgi:hypothetical protein